MYQSILHPGRGLIIGSIFVYFIILYSTLETGRAWLFFLTLAGLAIGFWSIVATVIVAAISLVVTNPFQALVGFAIFLIAGLVVALLKWRARVAYLVQHGYDHAKNSKDKYYPDEESWIKHAKDHIPKASHTKARIASWISYWPFYTIDYLVLLVFRDFFEKIAEWTVGIFNRVTDSVSSNAINKLRKQSQQEIQ